MQKTYPKSDALIGRFPEFGRSDLAEILRGGRYGNSTVDEWLDLLKDLELGSRYHTLNSSRFSSRFDRAPVYHGLPEIPPSELDKIF